VAAPTTRRTDAAAVSWASWGGNVNDDSPNTEPAVPSSEPESLPPSSTLDRLLGGFDLASSNESEVDSERPTSVRVGNCIAERFAVQRLVVRTERMSLFVAQDDTLDRLVTLKVPRLAASAHTASELARIELLLARSMSHPNICRVHDLIQWHGRSLLVMEPSDATLGQSMSAWAATSWPDLDSLREIFNGLCSAVTAIHDQGLVHGALNPENILLRGGTPKILFGPTTAREAVITGACIEDLMQLDPSYFSRQRLADAHTSPADDIYALGLLLWSLLSRSTVELGINPRATPMLKTMPPVIAADLPINDLRRMFDALSDDIALRPKASRLQLRSSHPILDPSTGDAGSPPPAHSRAFPKGDQGLLITYATNEKLKGTLYPLEAIDLTVGRGADIAIAEPTLSREHVRMQWVEGTWHVTDLGSTNGTYLDHAYEDRDKLILRHGDALQLGELRMRLVRFRPNSVRHWRANGRLKTRDGLTGFLLGPHFVRAAEETAEFADWVGVNTWVMCFELELPTELTAPVAMVAARRAATQVQGLVGDIWPGFSCFGLRRPWAQRPSEPALMTVVAGRIRDAPEHVLNSVAKGVKRQLPSGATIRAKIYRREHGENMAQVLFDVSAVE
jgi:eukaryotic-like serine/threonine-protein kinase